MATVTDRGLAVCSAVGPSVTRLPLKLQRPDLGCHPACNRPRRSSHRAAIAAISNRARHRSRPATPIPWPLASVSWNPLFSATVQATEEAIVNALVAAESMTGIDDHRVEAIPHDRLKEALKKYGRSK